MPAKNIVLPLVAGAAVGAVVGYAVASATGAALPKIDLDRYSVPIGQNYTMTLRGFPPNKQIVAPQSLYPPSTVNLGVTDASGMLVVGPRPAVGPAGTYYLIAWDALTGKYCAVVTLIVT